MKTTFIAQAAGASIVDGEPFGTITMSRDPESGEEAPDVAQRNPHVAAFAKRAGITSQDVRKHGPKAFNVLPNLRELVGATEGRDR